MSMILCCSQREQWSLHGYGKEGVKSHASLFSACESGEIEEGGETERETRVSEEIAQDRRTIL